MLWNDSYLGVHSVNREVASGARKVIRVNQKVENTLTELSLWSRLQRWFLQTVVGLGVLAVLLGAIQSGLYLFDLQIERIGITGTIANVSVEEIEARVGPSLQVGFLAADLDEAREHLESLPWVYSANVRRRWPNAVIIQIEEQRPIARWGSTGFLNHEGEYFSSEMAERWDGLAKLEGPDGSEARMMRRYQSLDALLISTGRQVVWLDEDDIGQVSAALDNGTLLILGSRHFVQRVRRFVTLQQDHLAGDAPVRVDLRYEHGVAVGLLEIVDGNSDFVLTDALSNLDFYTNSHPAARRENMKEAQ